WIAEGRRSQVLPLLLLTSAGAVLLLFACYSFSPDPFSYVFRSSDAFVWFSLDPVRRFFGTFANAGITIASGAALIFYLGLRKSRYFGNTAPLLCTIVLLPLVMTGAPGSPWIWAQPFLITFIAGVFADACESQRGRMALIAAGVIVALQAALCLSTLSGMV